MSQDGESQPDSHAKPTRTEGPGSSQDYELTNSELGETSPELGRGQTADRVADLLDRNADEWPQANLRRWELIMKKHRGAGLTEAEALELADLQVQGKSRKYG